MQRAARQLIRLVTCDLRKALHMNTAFFHTAAAAAVAHHHHHHHHYHQSAVASRPIHISVLQLLCPSYSGLWLIRCYCNGCSLPSLLTQDNDGLHATEQTKTDDLHFLAGGNSTGVGKDGFESGVRQAVNQNSINASEPSADCMLVSSTVTWNQENKLDGTPSTGGDKAGFSLVLLSDTEGEPNTKHTILDGVSTELHCIQSAKEGKKSKPEMLPSGIASQSVADRTIGGRNHVVLDGLSLSGDSIRSDLSEATSPSGTASQALADRGVGDGNYVVLDGLSSLGDGIRSDLTEARVGHMVDQNSVQSSEPSVDASLVSFILDQHGWGPHTEGMLQHFLGRLTPELVTSIVGKQKNAKVAMCFLEWAGNQEKYEHRAEIFTKVIGRLGKDMNFSAAWNVLEFMRKHGLKVDYAFSVFIHRLKSANMVDEVVKAMDYMGRLDVIPTVPLYTSALQLILKANNLGEAQRLYKQMHRSGLQPDIKLYGVLISGFGRAGKLDDAIFLFKEMQSHGVTPDTFTYISLIRAFAAVGQFKNGQKICMEMVQNNCLPKVLSRLDLGCALHGVSSMEQIRRFLDDVEMKGHVISVYTYNNMVQHLLENEMLSEAIEVFHRLSGEVQACNGSSSNLNERAARPNLDSYSLLIHGLCKGGKLREAVHFYKEMLVRRLKSSKEICNCLLLGLSNAGLIYEAVELSKHIMKEKLIVDVETQKTFFRALNAAGDLSKALKIFETMKWRGCIDQSLNFHALIGVGW